MTSALVVIVEGLAAGAVPGLLGAGLALVHRTTGVLSFAQAAIGAAGAYVAWASLGPGPHVAGALIAAGAAALLALPLGPSTRALGPDRPRLAILVTLGWGMVLETVLRLVFGADVKPFLHLLAREAPVPLPGGSLPASELILLGTTLLAVGTGALLLSRTRAGLALRALGAHREAAAALGLPIARLEALAWTTSGAAAGLSGWLLAPRLGLEPSLLWGPMVGGFVAAAVGGLDHPGRALGAGLGLGLLIRVAHLGMGDAAPVVQWTALGLALALSAGRR